MARRQRQLLLPLIWPLLFTFAAATFNLSKEITSFIPSCALSCFQSFLEVNYKISPCGTLNPALQCLCSRTGPSGFTLGEGAAQCVTAEIQAQNCVGKDANSESFGNHIWGS